MISVLIHSPLVLAVKQLALRMGVLICREIVAETEYFDYDLFSGEGGDCGPSDGSALLRALDAREA